MAKKITEKQSAFLDFLFGSAEGNAYKAKVMAGYSPDYPTSALVKVVEDEIVERTRRYLVEHGPKAVFALVSVLDDPAQLGVKHKVTVAKDLLDRIGVVKTEKLEVKSNGVFILPPKESDDD